MQRLLQIGFYNINVTFTWDCSDALCHFLNILEAQVGLNCRDRSVAIFVPDMQQDSLRSKLRLILAYPFRGHSISQLIETYIALYFIETVLPSRYPECT